MILNSKNRVMRGPTAQDPNPITINRMAKDIKTPAATRLRQSLGVSNLMLNPMRAANLTAKTIFHRENRQLINLEARNPLAATAGARDRKP